MKKLLKRLFRKSRDPLSELRAEPSEEERARYRVEMIHETRVDALRRGSALLSDYSNVAYGSPGYAIHSLWDDGLMDARRETVNGAGYWRLCITPLGRSYLKQWESA